MSKVLCVSICPKCSGMVFAAEWVRHSDKYWHKSCLRCQTCNKSLDGHEGIDRKGEPYCSDCFHKNFGLGFGEIGSLPKDKESCSSALETEKPELPDDSSVIHFECEYSEGCHPMVLEKFLQSNLEQTFGYGVDRYCTVASDKIKKAIKNDDAAVHFIVGGTLANLIVISSILKAHEGVIAADTSHIYMMETGAIEATGHRIIAFQSTDTNAKITSEQIKSFVQNHKNASNKVHTVKPGMVYITQPTENGTLYSLQELEAISSVCHGYNLPLYLDGARLAMAIASPDSDVTLADIARTCDVFVIGGAKCGLLMGEAIVITNPDLQTDFRYVIKQKGGLLSKARVLGLGFDVLFTDNLYYRLGKHADDLALLIRAAFREKGYSFYCNTSTNQQFPILPNEKLVELQKHYSFAFWRVVDSKHTAVRISTSWATPEESVAKLVKDIQAL